MAARNPQSTGNAPLLPPQNIEAEEAILAAILVDNNVLLDIVEVLSPEDFYRTANGKIYTGILDLFSQNEPIDLLTLADVMKRSGTLDEVGGGPYINSLVDSVPMAVNAGQYAKIIHDKACLRRLIEKSNAITRRCFEELGNVDEIIDFAETSIFEISEEKVRPSFSHIAGIVNDNIDALEKRAENKALVTGVTTGFTDLDNITSGLQGSDLIILAARPSMGKCCEASTEVVLEDGSIRTIEEICRHREGRLLTLNGKWKFQMTEPSDFIDDGLKDVFRVTTRLGRCVETTRSHPFLTIRGWKPLFELEAGNKIAVPRTINVFGNEAMRSCEVKLLAYLIGDGSLTGSCPKFTNTNTRILDDFVEAAESFGGVRTSLTEYSGKAAEVRIASKNDYAENREVFGRILQEKITQAGLSNNQFAGRIGVSPASVCGWTNGRYVPSAATFAAITEFFNDDLSALMPGGYASAAKNHKNALALWLDELGINGKNSHEKYIPDPIFKLPGNLLALFLNRLFSTDGWAALLDSGQAQLGYCSVSEKLIRQLQHLLLRFGIVAKIRKRGIAYAGKRNPAWQLDITDAISIRTFISDIGIFGKEEALQKIGEALSAKTYKTNTDLIPVGIWEKLNVARDGESWSRLGQRAGISGHTNMHVGKRSLSRSRLFALANALNNVELMDMAAGDIYWDEIVSIEPVGKKQVYDLTIPDTHNFVANDICVHNTAFALNIARNAAVKKNVPVAVFSLEMSKEQLSMRMLCSEARVDSFRLRGGFLDQEHWGNLTDAAGVLSEAPIYIDDTPAISSMEIRSKARRLMMEKGLGMVIIDYLQLMKAHTQTERRDLEISDISRSLKILAKELNIPVMALSQLNRKLEERADKRPLLSDLRESGALEQDADVVAFIYRDEVYNKDEQNPNRGIAEIIIAKQRNGPVGDVRLKFFNSHTRFEDLAMHHVGHE